MRRHFEISISNKLRPMHGNEPHTGSASRLKTLLYGLAAAVLVSAALIVGVALGTAVAATIGVLVIVAFAILIARGVIDRMRSAKPTNNQTKER